MNLQHLCKKTKIKGCVYFVGDFFSFRPGTFSSEGRSYKHFSV